MPLTFEAEGIDRVIKRLEGMGDNIQAFGQRDMPDELFNWQAEDMKRRYPEVETPDDKTAETEIFPRSRLPSKHVRQPSAQARRISIARPKGGGGRPISTRPILRDELFEKLVERMGALLETALAWAKTRQT
jgi:hypothetical protein